MSEQESAAAEEAARLEGVRLEREHGELLDRAWDMYAFGGRMYDLLMTLEDTPDATIETFRELYAVKVEWQQTILDRTAGEYVRRRDVVTVAQGHMDRLLAKPSLQEGYPNDERMARVLFARMAGGLPSGRVRMERRGIMFVLLAESDEDITKIWGRSTVGVPEETPHGLAFGQVSMDHWEDGLEFPVIVVSEKDKALVREIVDHEEQHILTSSVFAPSEENPSVWGDGAIFQMKDELLAFTKDGTVPRGIRYTLAGSYQGILAALPEPLGSSVENFLSEYERALSRFDLHPVASRKKLVHALLKVPVESLPRAIDLVAEALERRFPDLT